MGCSSLDRRIKSYEIKKDISVMPGMFIITCLTGGTKEHYSFTAPFDERFRDYMVQTTEHLMNCGFKIIYGYTQSDEISLLFDYDEDSFARKVRKLNSILAGEASAKFSTLLGGVGAFDCRLSAFPNKNLVIDYFRWRSEDAHRNSLNAHCYWALRKAGYTKREATKRIEKISVADKNELLYSQGINYNKLPAWQKRGIGLYWKETEKESINPKTGEKVIAIRNRLYVDYELPVKESYYKLIETILSK
ncbi:MAG: hypothetical protein LBV43_12030 [Prevotella sp.]|jgi:tRNA(His) 5'-end guanylyltransferase|nr:hypothetical protein [Prevotella sp.]